MNTEPNEAVYWAQVAESRLQTIYQERDAKRALQERFDALDAEHAKLVQDYEALHKEHQTALTDRDHWRRQAADVTAGARRRQERAERYGRRWIERASSKDEFEAAWDAWLDEQQYLRRWFNGQRDAS